MSVFLEDTARNNLPTWATTAIKEHYAKGVYLSPFASPKLGNGYKRAAADVAKSVITAGGEFWFDPMTYALSMPRTGDFRHYDSWDLWGPNRGTLDTPEAQDDHLNRVFDIQDELGSPHLAPAILVSYPDTLTSQRALDLSQRAVDISPDTWLTIAGDQQFWSAGAELDAHIGALDQLQPAGWLLVVTRSDNAMPPSATAEEVYGIMRTTYALSQDRPVRIAFGDLAALPAIAAGAEALGTGWDLRQRLCAYQDFEERPADASTGGGWYQRPTLEGLFGGLTNGEYDILVSENAALAIRLTPGAIGPKPQQAFRHHAATLTRIIDKLKTLSDRQRVEHLRDLYLGAQKEWPRVRQITGAKIGSDRWIKPFLDGVKLFSDSEGWS